MRTKYIECEPPDATHARTASGEIMPIIRAGLWRIELEDGLIPVSMFDRFGITPVREVKVEPVTVERGIHWNSGPLPWVFIPEDADLSRKVTLAYWPKEEA